MSAKVKGITLTHNTDIRNLVPERLAVDPANPELGRIWFNTTEKVIKTTDTSGNIIALGASNEVDLTAITTNIIPANNSVLELGSPTNRFKTIYVDEAKLSTNTLYIGDTPILGTSADTIQIHSDAGQSISMYTTGNGVTTSIGSSSKVELSTDGMNADVVIQASGSGSKVRLGSTAGTDIIGQLNVQNNMNVSGNLTLTGNLYVTGTQTVVDTTVLSVKDNIIDLNSGELGSGVTAGTAGFKVKRGDLSDMVLVFDESDDKFKVGLNGTELETIATREWVGTQNFGSGSGTTTSTTVNGAIGIKYATVGWSNVYPALNAFCPFMSSFSNATIDSAQKIDNNTMLLKAGKIYKIDGGIEWINNSGGVIVTQFAVYNDATGTSKISNLTDGENYIANASLSSQRDVFSHGYYTPTKDCYLKMYASSSTMTSPTTLTAQWTITEYDVVTAQDITFSSMGEMPGYSTEEVLTDRRWIDGKPIYRKYFKLGDLTSSLIADNGTTNTFDLVSASVAENTVDAKIFLGNSTNIYSYFIDAAHQRRQWASATKLYIITSSGEKSTFNDVRVLVEYTKISDSASTPVSTPKVTTGTIDMPGYSTSEVLTEKRWIDGKPIYRSVLKLSNLTQNNTSITVSYPSYITDIETVTNGTTLWNDNVVDSGWDSADAYTREMMFLPSGIRYRLGTSSGTSYATAIVEYTKTTDTANSPTAVNNLVVSQGAQALPGYSTSEVLTERRWIDGKPIYRKVVTGTIPTPANDFAITPNISGADKMYVSDALVFLADGSSMSSADTFYSSDTSEFRAYVDSSRNISVYVSDSATSLAGLTVYVIVEYTKTSDTSASPVALVGNTNSLPTSVSNPVAGQTMVFDGNNWVNQSKVFAKVKNSAISAGIVPNTWTNITLNNVTSGTVSLSGNGFIIPQDGIYNVNVNFFSNSSNNGNISEVNIRLLKNGTTIETQWNGDLNSGGNQGALCSFIESLSKNDVLTFQIWCWNGIDTTPMYFPANSFMVTITN